MRHRFIGLAMLCSTVLSASASAQNPRGADGLIPGDYARLSFSSVTPVNPSGSLKQWKSGNGVNFMWENWSTGTRNGVAMVGFGLYGDLALLPFDEAKFIEDFSSGPNGVVISARAGRARAIQLGVNTRVRLPVPYVTPSVSFGFGFIDWRPAKIDYTATLGSGTAKQQSRQGGVVSIIGGLDKNIYDRFAVFGEAAYSYGFTSFGRGLAASGSACVAANCDLLKNTPFGSLRAGLRVRASR